MANLIQLKRSAVPGHTPTTTQLSTGELAVNSYDGKAYMLQDQTSTGGIKQVIEVGKRGATAVKQVYYVSKSGSDLNDGSALDRSKASVKSAVEATRNMIATAIATVTSGQITSLTVTNGGAGYVDQNYPPAVTIFDSLGSGAEVLAIVDDGEVIGFTIINPGTGYSSSPEVYITPSGGDAVIFVKSGDYTEMNPIYIPRGVSVVGDSLRTTTIRPANPGLDLFWVNNKSYFTEMTYRGHEAPAAVFTFPSQKISGITNSITGKPARIKFTGGFTYNRALCYRDTGLVIDSLANDLLFGASTVSSYGGNPDSQSTFTGLQYWSHTNPTQGGVNLANEIPAIILTLAHMASFISATYSDSGASSYFTVIEQILNKSISLSTITDYIVPNTLVRATTGAAYNTAQVLQTHRAAIVANALAYAISIYPLSSASQTTCARDIGYILDSVTFDLLYGGNKQTVQSGVYYYSFSSTSSSVVSAEKPQVTAAYNYIKTLTSYVVRRLAVPTTYQTGVTQSLVGSAGTLSDATTTNTNIDRITSIINGGPLVLIGGLPVAQTPITLTENATTKNGATQLYTNRDFIAAEVVAYINQLPSYVPYNSAKCARDTALIIDALAEDLLFGGTSQTDFAGLQYWTNTGTTGNVLPIDEVTPTINAFTYLRDNVLPTYITTVNDAVNAEMTTIIQILSGTITPSQVTGLIVPNGTVPTTDPNVQADIASLQSNKGTIATAVYTFVNTTYPTLVYNQATCARDVGYIIDSICFDLNLPATSGQANRQAIQAGTYYLGYSNTTSAIPNETTQVTDAYTYLSELLGYVVTNTAVPAVYQTNAPQVFLSNVGSSTQVTALQNNVSLILNIINNGPTWIDLPAKKPIGLTPSSAAYQYAFDLIQANKKFITEEVVAYIDGFSYNRTYCARDTGLIVDAIAQDLLFDGDSQTTFASVQYWTQGQAAADLVIPSNEKAATVAAIQYAGQRAYYWAGQDGAANTNDQLFVQNEFNLIANIISSGTVQITNTIVPNSLTATSNATALAVFASLQNRKATIAGEVTSWIASNYPSLVYNVAKCQRDIGYMIDSISVDVKYNADPTYAIPSNRQAIQSGVYYYGYDGGISYVAGELAATVSAYDYIKYLATYIVQGATVPTRYQSTVAQAPVSGDATIDEVNAIYRKVDNMVNIITVGPKSAPAPRPIAVTTTTNPNIINAALALHNNRAFIVAEVLGYVDANFSKGHQYRSGDAISIKGVEGMTEINNGYDHVISTISNAAPAKITFTKPHTLDNRQELKIYGVIGMSDINAKRYYAKYISTTEAEIYNDVYLSDPVDSTAYGAYTSGGRIETDTFYYVKKVSYNQCDLFLDRALTKPVDSSLWGTYLAGGYAGTGSLPISPYVHNCSSITTTGTGMRVNGDLSTGLRSMVLDSFTQINEGGIGIEILNRGYAQLVSIYTICTDKGVYAHGGGFCSLENSNCSFGNYALYSDGLSGILYSGVSTGVNQTGKNIALKGMNKKPSYDDAMDITSTLGISSIKIRSGGATVNLANPGAGYHPNDVLTLSGGTLGIGGTASIFNVETVKAISGTRTSAGTKSDYVTGDVLSFNTGFSTPLAISVTASGGVVTGLQSIVNPGIKNTPVVGALHPDYINGVAVTGNSNGLDTTFTFVYGVNSVTPTSNTSEFYTVAPTGTGISGNTVVGISTSAVRSGSPLTPASAVKLDAYFTIRVTFSTLHYFLGGETVVITGVGGMTQLNGNSYYINLIGSGYAVDLYDDVALVTGVDTLGFGTYTSSGTATVHDYYTVIGATQPVVNPADGLITTIISLEVGVKRPIPDGAAIDFRNRSRIQSSGHGFEFIGSGTVLATATPASGAYPIPGNEVFEANGGKVYFTGTTEQGDFKIGTELTINRDTGTISGRTFDKSLFAIMTPYILALEG